MKVCTSRVSMDVTVVLKERLSVANQTAAWRALRHSHHNRECSRYGETARKAKCPPPCRLCRFAQSALGHQLSGLLAIVVDLIVAISDGVEWGERCGGIVPRSIRATEIELRPTARRYVWCALLKAPVGCYNRLTTTASVRRRGENPHPTYPASPLRVALAYAAGRKAADPCGRSSRDDVHFRAFVEVP